MAYRSWLIVPGDSENKLDKVLATGADVVVIDLEATVPHEAKNAARRLAAEWLKAHRQQIPGQRAMARWVRINGQDSRMWRDDLLAVLPGAPEGIVLPRSAGPEAVRQLAAELYEFEQANQIMPGSTRILPQVGETANATMSLGAYIDTSLPRMTGLAWSAAELARSINATRLRDARGAWSDTFRFVRAQTLLTAHSCGVMALETLLANADDTKGARLAAKEARADGFTGMLTHHPEHIAEIDAAFTPSEAELEEARQLVSAFEGTVREEAVLVDRRGIEPSQLKLAKQTLGLTASRSPENQRVPILRRT